jgi:hypothetical protein
MCDATDADFARLNQIASETKDANLSAALLLIVRGQTLPPMVIRSALIAAGCLLDTVEMMQRVRK